MISINTLEIVTIPINLALNVFEVVIGWRLTNDEVLRQHSGLERDLHERIEAIRVYLTMGGKNLTTTMCREGRKNVGSKVPLLLYGSLTNQGFVAAWA